MTVDNSVSHRLVIRFKTKKQMHKVKKVFEKTSGVIHVEERTRKDVEEVGD